VFGFALSLIEKSLSYGSCDVYHSLQFSSCSCSKHFRFCGSSWGLWWYSKMTFTCQWGASLYFSRNLFSVSVHISLSTVSQFLNCQLPFPLKLISTITFVIRPLHLPGFCCRSIPHCTVLCSHPRYHCDIGWWFGSYPLSSTLFQVLGMTWCSLLPIL